MLPAFPQGLKPKFVLWRSRHATQRVPRSCPFKTATKVGPLQNHDKSRALSKSRLNQRLLKNLPANPMWKRREGKWCLPPSEGGYCVLFGINRALDKLPTMEAKISLRFAGESVTEE